MRSRRVRARTCPDIERNPWQCTSRVRTDVRPQTNWGGNCTVGVHLGECGHYPPPIRDIGEDITHVARRAHGSHALAGRDIARYTLKQLPDPMVFNAKGTVHGGVSATAAELVASAAIWGETSGGGFRSGSLHVNFLRPFIADADSHYRGIRRACGFNSRRRRSASNRIKRQDSGHSTVHRISIDVGAESISLYELLGASGRAADRTSRES